MNTGASSERRCGFRFLSDGGESYDMPESIRSASIAVYRPQAELFGGRTDGKFVVRLEKD
jgi:hypothetical protein